MLLDRLRHCSYSTHMTNAQERKAQERQARRRRIQEAARTVFAERGHAGVHARFGHGDLASILDHHATTGAGSPRHRAGEDGSLTQGTSGWAALGPAATGERHDDGEQEVAL